MQYEFRGAWTLLVDAIRFFKTNFLKYLLISLPIFGASLIYLHILYPWILGSGLGFYGKVGAIFFGFLVLLLLGSWTQLNFYRISLSSRGTLFQFDWKQLLVFIFFTLILLNFFVAGGFFFLIFPGILFAMWGALSIPVFIREGKSPLESMITAFGYIRTQFWRVVWHFCIFFIPFIILSVGLEFIPDFFAAESWIFFVAEVCVSILGWILGVIALIYLCLVYEDLSRSGGSVSAVESKILKWIIGFFVGFSAVVILGFIFLLSVLFRDGKVEDALRLEHRAILAAALNHYSLDHEGVFPPTFDELVPTYLPILPRDPETNILYDYLLKTDGLDYKFCQIMSLGERDCFDSRGEAYYEVQGQDFVI
ncbi:MAG: hypothetical protein G01um101418_458 [Parcubacteria group bacterium Gr01-1014_18]|nr:MAG: hypothetical protein Greene041636_503 [Parcubacteria group bacterium Greene0416_36]TSC81045.1 MAG: hypothetical protein G01um101418_458 [Parcubacteria group bacterium Gr01-1014_18]TSC98967.1 MAG: hypothetical protein Greene101420_479 [Parcubacteria group bacterium Greene1014_20]TSD06741.1 MAG: hypothetical protein Greene07142_662 [Parcubacteria group bacterium Greene0714_2]